MKKVITTLVLLVYFCFNGNAQQWVDSLYAVDTIQDITYGSAVNFNNTSVNLKLDIYLPVCQDTTTNRPLMMVVHGGGLIIGTRKDQSIQETCRKFAERGYVTVSVQYRLGYVNDNALHQCNYPNYPCFYAADTLELVRSYYRGIQDVKGAMRYMINRKDSYHIDEQNVFLTGESAGSFLAMGAAFMDDPAERPAATFAIADVLYAPNSGTLTACSYYDGQNFSVPVARPDLGGIDGSIEPALYPFTIRGVGNMFGAMMGNLLTLDNSVTKPALFSFHQACDLVVPWDSKPAYWGLNWCFTNGYGCNALYNTPTVHGSKTISEWNTNQSLGYDILNNFLATPPFPYQYGILPQAPKSCINQFFEGGDCHSFAYNKPAVMNTMATFFSTKMVNADICAPFNSIISLDNNGLLIYPNPVEGMLNIKSDEQIVSIRILDLSGKSIQEFLVNDFTFESNLSALSSGVYMIECKFENDRKQQAIVRK